MLSMLVKKMPQSIQRGPVLEHLQDPIPQSSYHARLDAGEDEEDEDDLDVEMDEGEHNSVPDLTSSIRFWSDYSRVFYHPRGLHRIPDPAEWEREAGWPQGVKRFHAYDTNQAVLEDSFRLFAEECHLLQGVQLCMDAPSFGSFTVSLLSQFRDEYPKLPVLSFCSLSWHDPADVNLENTLGCVNALNDALTLNELAALLTLVVPLQSPTTWRRGPWSEHLKVDFTHPYHTSALLAAHIESSTLPLRLNASVPSSTGLASLCAQLNWRSNTPFVALSSAFPVTPSPPALEILIRLFTPCLTAQVPFAQRDVYWGLDAREKAAVQSWVVDAQSELQEPCLIRGRGLPLLVREAVVVAGRSNSTRAVRQNFHAPPLALLSASTAGSRGVKQHTPCTRWYLGPFLSRIRQLCSCCTSLVQLSNPQLPAIMLLESQEPSHATSYATSNSSELAVGSDMGRSGRGEQPACFQGAGKAVEQLLR
ncbi:tubulin domain-containing protein [Gautieria morchelliformis]|nr:tubulin domain-containing protein [Gautieria morchelliformis]